MIFDLFGTCLYSGESTFQVAFKFLSNAILNSSAHAKNNKKSFSLIVDSLFIQECLPTKLYTELWYVYTATTRFTVLKITGQIVGLLGSDTPPWVDPVMLQDWKLFNESQSRSKGSIGSSGQYFSMPGTSGSDPC
jgi:hypothetical protein